MITWHIKQFEELTTRELYAILALRNQVFIVEQKNPFQDIDTMDLYAWHVWGEEEGTMIAYLRLLPPGFNGYDTASMGRVITAPAYRGKGLGNQLLSKALSFMDQKGYEYIRNGALAYARPFYEKWGFAADSEEYEVDGVRHIHMIRKNPSL